MIAIVANTQERAALWLSRNPQTDETIFVPAHDESQMMGRKLEAVVVLDAPSYAVILAMVPCLHG